LQAGLCNCQQGKTTLLLLSSQATPLLKHTHDCLTFSTQTRGVVLLHAP
jgi:hypothetical protein